jgi:hypothetical protein
MYKRIIREYSGFDYHALQSLVTEELSFIDAKEHGVEARHVTPNVLLYVNAIHNPYFIPSLFDELPPNVECIYVNLQNTHPFTCLHLLADTDTSVFESANCCMLHTRWPLDNAGKDRYVRNCAQDLKSAFKAAIPDSAALATFLASFVSLDVPEHEWYLRFSCKATGGWDCKSSIKDHLSRLRKMRPEYYEYVIGIFMQEVAAIAQVGQLDQQFDVKRYFDLLQAMFTVAVYGIACKNKYRSHVFLVNEAHIDLITRLLAD